MIPTFDFSNLIRKIVFASGWSFLNPVAWVLALSISVGGLVAFITSQLNYFQIPTLDATIPSLSDSDLWHLFCYISALDHLSTVIDYVIRFFNLIIPFSISALVTFVSSCYVFRSSMTIRAAWSKLAGL